MEQPKNIVIFIDPTLVHQINWQVSMREGFWKHGIRSVTRSYNQTELTKLSDLVVCWGTRTAAKVIQYRRQHNLPYLVAERGFVGDRNHWTGLGFNGLNGRANFVNQNSPPDRWNKYFGDSWLKPWKTDGEYVLVLAQCQGDMSLEHCGFTVDYQAMVDEIKQYTDRPILFRKHPLYPVQPCPKGATPQTGTLDEALSNAWCAVTYNSNSAVDCVLAGVETFVDDWYGCMAQTLVWSLQTMPYFIAGEAYRIKRHYDDRSRQQWSHNIAYAQWSPTEIEDGTAWEHLKHFYDRAPLFAEQR